MSGTSAAWFACPTNNLGGASALHHAHSPAVEIQKLFLDDRVGMGRMVGGKARVAWHMALCMSCGSGALIDSF